MNESWWGEALPDSKLQRIAARMRLTGDDRARIKHQEQLRLTMQRLASLGKEVRDDTPVDQKPD